MVAYVSQDDATRTRWLVVLAGPLAWMIDEGIALVIEADVCSANVRHAPAAAQTILIGLAVAALAAIMLGAASALRTRRLLDVATTSVQTERAGFLALAALLLAGVSAFGVLLRLIASLAGGVCA